MAWHLKMLNLLFFWQFIAIVNIVSCEYLTVNTCSGPIVGVPQKTFVHQVPYISYKGIPYAQPPVDKLRFRVPRSVKPWTEPLVTTNEYRPSCLVIAQAFLFGLKSNQSEDCLFLNVYTPVLEKSKTKRKLPVLFYIHGGGFNEGDGTDAFQAPDFVMEHNAILVVINYRLGPFGYANFNLHGYTGNMALKDQRKALKWTKKNIKYFGGDPDAITMIGESAGAVQVHLHLLSNSCKYIKRAVMLSGNAFNYWSYYKNNNVDLFREAFKNELGDQTSDEEVLNYMINAPAESIVAKSPALDIISRTTLLFYWTPVVEDKRKAVHPFLLQKPHDIYANNNFCANCRNVEVVFSVTSSEGFSFLDYTQPYAWIEALKSSSYIALPYHGLTLTQDTAKYQAVQNKIKKFYFGDGEIEQTPERLNQYVQLTTDTNFVIPFYEAMRLHSKVAKTYCFYFDINLNTNIVKLPRNLTDIEGMGHIEDTGYLFKINEPKYSFLYDQTLADRSNEINRKTICAWKFVTKLFTDFARKGLVKYDNPVKSVKNAKCIHITNDGLRSITRPHGRAIKFWRKAKNCLYPFIVDEF
ncbi:juvenile hormone esterase-like [Contarinia nasturtii]|uniref:juvenile hormone esterase-like n=1 Tax=Contarinia nasturtii TaxID=265458 RepID=UPI0012D44B22|nr:juvenile hormone esterase-like [Contarinia nasturtii]